MKRILVCILPLCLSTPLLAQAADGYVVADISLQAGPDTQYPSITELPAGTPIHIEGCIEGYTWCDVVAGGDRGWVAGSFVQEQYNNQPVIIEDYGPRIGIPIVAFSLGVYWEQHYHNRPWYGERTQWESRHIQPHQPPRPSAEAIRNAPNLHEHYSGGRPGEHQADQHRSPPPPKPASAPVQPAQAAVTATTHQEPKPAPNKTRADVQSQRIKTPPPVAAHPAPPPHVATPAPKPEPKEVSPPKPESQAHTAAAPKVAPQPKARPKPEPKPEPKKDDGGRKDDSKDH
jgi:uncharacterized protein YraI